MQQSGRLSLDMASTHPEFKVEGSSPRNKSLASTVRDTDSKENKDVYIKNNIWPKKSTHLAPDQGSPASSGQIVQGKVKLGKKNQTSKILQKLCIYTRNKNDFTLQHSLDVKRNNAKTPTAEEIKMLEEVTRKLPEKAVFGILCNHFSNTASHTRDEFFRRAIKWRRGTSVRKGNNHCILCYIRSMASKPLQTDYEHVLSSILYSQDFYNQYSREEKQVGVTDPKELLQICKKADLMKKSRSLSTPPPGPPASALGENHPPQDISPKNVMERPDSEFSDAKTERLMQMYTIPKRDIHLKCKPKHQQFLLSAVDKPEVALVYKRKALRGCFPKKERTEKEKANEEIKQEKYPVGSLGLSFTIPQFNKNLPNREMPLMSKSPDIAPRFRRPVLPPIQRNDSEPVTS